MKKVILLSFCIVLMLAATSAFAADRYALGMSNLALKVDYFSFTEDVFDNIDLDDGVYVGLEASHALSPNFYLALEAGWAETESDGDVVVLGRPTNVDIEVTYVPIELNLKYALELSPSWVLGIGAGASYNYFNIEATRLDIDDDDWLLGGQVFADLTYKSGSWFFGINGKYQFTEDTELGSRDVETDTNANNFRVGAQLGVTF
ncbi:MAG: outer membrane beta-barrel protein [Thermodesulfovibrionales bacterium]